jgi:hypothetical protein
VSITSSFEQPADGRDWLTLIEFQADVSPEGFTDSAALTERLAEILIPLSISEARLQRIQAAAENSILHAAARSAGQTGKADGSARANSRLSSVSLRISVSRSIPGEAPPDGVARSLRETLPIWTGGPYGWGFFLVERAGPVPGEQPDPEEGANHLIQLFLYPEGGE